MAEGVARNANVRVRRVINVVKALFEAFEAPLRTPGDGLGSFVLSRLIQRLFHCQHDRVLDYADQRDDERAHGQ